MKFNNIGLSTSSLKYSLGLELSSNNYNPNPINFTSFLNFTKKLDLSGCEFPFLKFFSENDDIDNIISLLEDYNFFTLINCDKPIDLEQIKYLLPIVKKFKTRFIRVTTSNILSSERYKLGIKWSEHIKNIIIKINKIKPILRDYEVKLAIENHQDVDSEDLVQIIDSLGEDIVGVNFDVGNAYATCENILDFANKLSNSIINIHLKDYKICKSNKGFFLARCALGKGDVDFNELFVFIKKNAIKTKMIVEIGSLYAREIKFKNNQFWSFFNKNKFNNSKKFFEFANEKIKKNYHYEFRTPFEKKFNPSMITTYEFNEVKESINYLKKI